MPDKKIQPATRTDDLLIERQQPNQRAKNSTSKKVTILLSDICGDTRLAEKNGDLPARALMLRHNLILLPAIVKNSGKIIEEMSDGVMALFKSPLDAVKAAVNIHQNLITANEEASADEKIQVKIGINTGEVLFDEKADIQNLTGKTAKVAFLLQKHANKNDILISQSVYDSIQNDSKWLCRTHGKVKFKGTGVKTPVYRVQWHESITGGTNDAPAPGVHPTGSLPLEESTQKDTPTITLEFTCKDADLSISMYEGDQGYKRALSHHESIPFEAPTIEKGCKDLANTLNKADRMGRVSEDILGNLRETGRRLYDVLLSRYVKDRLLQTDATTLTLSINAPLVNIPWELLYDGSQFLCMRFSMGRLVKTDQPPEKQADLFPISRLNMLVFADPTKDLKSASTEKDQICDFLVEHPKLIKTFLPTKEMTVETLKAGLREFDLVHFTGTAGYDAKEPSVCGWHLHDGKLTPHDITRTADNTKMPSLVFANTCQSANTDQCVLNDTFEHDVFGLANAFLLAGVKHYIGTFWKIIDNPSSHFAIEFYKQLLSGQSVGSAVLKARKALVSQFGEETIIWASYVLYGDPTQNYKSQIIAPKEAPAQQNTGVGIIEEEKDRVIQNDRKVVTFSGNKSKVLLSLAAACFLLLIVCGWFLSPWHQSQTIEALEKKALSFYQLGDYKNADQTSLKLLQDAPDRPASALILGDIRLSRGELTQAKQYYDMALEKSTPAGQTRNKALMRLGRLSSIESRQQEAIDYYRSAAEEKKDNFIAISSEAVLLERQGNLEEAYQAYKRAASFSRDDTGLAVIANQILDRISFMKDISRQDQIDQIIEAIMSNDQTQKASPEQQWRTTPLAIWIPNFQTTGVNRHEITERLIHGIITDKLTDNKRMALIDKALLEKLLSELKLDPSKLSDPDTARGIGRLMSVRVLIFGHLSYIQNQVKVAMRLVDCETGMVIASVIEQFENKAYPENIANQIAPKILDSLVHLFPIRATVMNTGSGIAIIDVGNNHGVSPEMEFKDLDGKVTVQIRSIGIESSKVNIIAGKTLIQPGLKLEEQFYSGY